MLIHCLIQENTSSTEWIARSMQRCRLSTCKGLLAGTQGATHDTKKQAEGNNSTNTAARTRSSAVINLRLALFQMMKQPDTFRVTFNLQEMPETATHGRPTSKPGPANSQ
mmetsp:Transcript_26768/g.79108  ORF Transcript_26768/g.79108 Transcript_26768/m.79108 type:complete len:110 (-) Transcript_26768:854-1183(-)